jgi:hypothetical protein
MIILVVVHFCIGKLYNQRTSVEHVSIGSLLRTGGILRWKREGTKAQKNEETRTWRLIEEEEIEIATYTRHSATERNTRESPSYLFGGILYKAVASREAGFWPVRVPEEGFAHDLTILSKVLENVYSITTTHQGTTQ